MRSNYRASALVIAIAAGATTMAVWLTLAWIFGSVQQVISGLMSGVVVFTVTYFMQVLIQKLFGPYSRL